LLDFVRDDCIIDKTLLKALETRGRRVELPLFRSFNHKESLMRIRTVLLAAVALFVLIGGCDDRSVVTIRAKIGNQPTTVSNVAAGLIWQHDFTIDGGITGTAYAWQVVAVGSPPHGEFGIDSIGVFTFHTTVVDSNQSFSFRVLLTDYKGRTDKCDFTVAVSGPRPLIIRIESVPTLLGHAQYVSIIKESGPEELGGFNLLLGWDARALTFIYAKLGVDIGSASCGWEYLAYRYAEPESGTGPYPIGTLRVMALADQNDGPHHPVCFTVPDGGELARLKFKVSNDSSYDCQFLPIRFFWTSNLSDNTLRTRSGDSAYVVKQVFDWMWDGNPSNSVGELTGQDCDSSWGFHYGGQCEPYSSWHGFPGIPVPEVIFQNGGFDIVCTGYPEAYGDLNLNGIAGEIADLELYAQYFLHGIKVFPQDPQKLQAVTKISDVNGDGLPFTVADYVYLIRVILGDPLPRAQLHPLADRVELTLNRGIVSAESSVSLGGLSFTYAVSGEYQIDSLSSLSLISADSAGTLKILMPGVQRDLTVRISPGQHDLFRITGNATLISVQASDYDGNLLVVRY
jgi:hypothetical protein